MLHLSWISNILISTTNAPQETCLLFMKDESIILVHFLWQSKAQISSTICCILYRRHCTSLSALINTSRREWLFLKMWRSRTCQFIVPLFRRDSYPVGHVSLSPWAQRLDWEKQNCGFLCFCLPLMKCTISSVPKLVTVLQVIKHGISFNSKWHNHAYILSCCNIRNVFSSNKRLLNHVHAFPRAPICLQIVKYEYVINQDI